MTSKRRVFQPVELAFLDAIHSSPFDDSPRLIWADWLEEYNVDAEYAELIRLTVQEERLASTSAEFKARIKELAQRVRRRYVSPVPIRTKLCSWGRGLPWLTTTMNGIWAEYIGDFADDCAPRMSPLFSFSLTLAYRSAAALRAALSHPLMKQIHEIHFYGRPATTLEHVQIIANSPYVSRLEGIVVRRTDPAERELVFSALAGCLNAGIAVAGLLSPDDP